MAAPAMSPADMKALDQTRQRLSQLNSSLQSLLTQLHNTDPLPSWSHLTQLSTVISQNLSALSSLNSEHHDLLAACAAYPLPAYPGRQQEALLEQLLRKKLEPDIEERVAAGRARGEAAEAAGRLANPDSLETRRDTLRELWSWAGMAANEQARQHHWGADYTRDEVAAGVENVVTGLKRKLALPDEDDDDDDDDDEDDDEEAVEDGEGDDGIAMVGIRRGSTSAKLEFDILGNGDNSDALKSTATMPVGAQLRYMMTGK